MQLLSQCTCVCIFFLTFIPVLCIDIRIAAQFSVTLHPYRGHTETMRVVSSHKVIKKSEGFQFFHCMLKFACASDKNWTYRPTESSLRAVP